MREKREPTGGKHLWTPTHQQSANAPFLARALEPRMSDGYCVKPGPADLLDVPRSWNHSCNHYHMGKANVDYMCCTYGANGVVMF